METKNSNPKNVEMKDLLTSEELLVLKGGKGFDASSIRMSAAQMGNSSCCNVHIEIDKHKLQ